MQISIVNRYRHLYRKTYTILLFLLCGFSNIIYSQTEIDSLLQVFDQTQDNLKRLIVLDSLTKRMIESNHDQQFEYLEKTIHLAKKLDDYDLMALKSRFIIQNYIWSGKNDKALQVIEELLTHKEKFKTQKSEAHLLLKRGAVYYNQEQLNKAVSDYNRSSTLFLKTEDSIYAADGMYFAAQVYSNLNDFVKSVNKYKKAHQLYEILGDTNYALYAAIELNDLYSKNGFSQKAIANREKLIKSIQKGNNDDDKYRIQAKVLQSNINDYLKIKDYDSHKKTIDRLEAIFDSVPNGSFKRTLHLLLKGSYTDYLLLNDELAIAKKYLDTCEKLLAKTESPQYYEAKVLILKAKYYQKTEDLQKAQTALKKILAKKGKISDIDFHIEAQRMLSEIYVTNGKYKEAFELIKSNSVTKDSIYTSNNTNSLLYHQSIFETVQREKEIIKQNAAIQQLENEKEIATTKRNTLLIILAIIIVVAFGVTYYIWRYGKQKRKRLATKIEKNEKELAKFTKQLLEKGDAQEKLVKELEELKSEFGEKQSLKNLQELTTNKILTKDDWYTFREKFVLVHPNFFSRIENKGYKLTKSEERLVAMEKLGLNTGQIANLLVISEDSVMMNRYRLRKKISAPKGAPILEYLEAS